MTTSSSGRHGGALALTIAIGALGGALFAWLRMPLAWMIGAMVATTVAALAGRAVPVPRPLRSTMIVVIGVLLGAGFTPEVIEAARAWPMTLAGLVGYIGLATATLYLYFTRALGYDRLTAYFCATPGGLTEMVLQGGAAGADDRSIALVHGARVLLVVLVIPFWFRFTEGVTTSVSTSAPGLGDVAPADAVILLACAVVGTVGGRLLRLPAYMLVGPMLASGAVHATGISSSSPPWQLVALAQVVVGSAIGGRFAGLAVSQLARGVAASVGSTALLLALTAAFTLVVAPLAGVAHPPVLLAYAPGGLAEMSLIALALGIETAFVATHHVFRIGLIVIGAPLVLRLIRGR